MVLAGLLGSFVIVLVAGLLASREDTPNPPSMDLTARSMDLTVRLSTSQDWTSLLLGDRGSSTVTVCLLPSADWVQAATEGWSKHDDGSYCYQAAVDGRSRDLGATLSQPDQVSSPRQKQP